MARFEIKSKDGLSVRFSGKPVYNGSYLKPSSLTFSEVNSPTPIAWEVGDYVDYTRTGMRYYLYSIPQPTKRAKIGSRGDAFSYSGVQFFAATKELEIALFKDIVNSDNNIHFSTSPDVATFENVEGVARRIQSCMDYFFPNRWEIRIADFDAVEDAEIIEKINTAKDFALSNGTCLDALSRIYELWQDIGWIHTNENGKEVIIIGYPNKRISENTTDAFVYGKGNGLTAIKKNQTNREEFATRLYVYGSERNLPARYYNDKDILNAESVDIRNLMLPLDKWGLTDGKPDARKAYLENAEAVAKYGLIPKTHYFDSEEAGADIYPTISGMTIGKIREALTALGQTDSAYFPSAELYPDASQRVDKVRWCDNPDDHGDVGDVLLNGSPSMFDGETKSVDVSSGTRTANIVENKLMASAEFSYSESRTCKARFSTTVSGYVNDDGFEGVVVKMRLSDSNNANSSMSKVVEYPAVLNGGKWEFTLPSVEYDYGQIPKAIFGAYAFLTIAVTLPSGSKDKSISYVLNTGIQHLDLYLIMEKTFLLRLHEIGFDIDKQASLGKGKVISMKTGACAGRSFVIESCRHKGGIYTQGYWDLTLKRQKDNTLGLMFPNVNAQIAEGDEFVLTDIAMPELYVQAAMLRLLSEGQKLLTRASSIQNLYEPSIDAKVMIEQGRTLREGMFMEISDADVVDNTTEYILIDTLSIHEDESAIPTYKVTLKERRKVTYKGTPSATSADNTESVEDDVQTEVNIDLSEYAKKAEVEEVSELLSTMWQLEGDTIVATKDVRIKANLIVEQDTSSGGEGQDTPGAGLDEDEVLDIVKGYTYSKSEINKLIDDVNAGDIDLTNYYTKQEVDAKIPSLEGYAKTTEVDNKINELNLSQYAKDSDLDALQAEVDNIDAVLGLSETAEGYINTWAEVVAFLDAIEQEKDLASILETMNTNIGKNATDIESLTTRVEAEEGVTETYKTWWADLKKYIKVENGNVKVDTNLIITGDTSSEGSGQDTPASGTVTGIKVSASETLTPNNAGIIDMVSVLSSIDVSDQLKDYAKLTDIPSLDGYATETWVTNKKYLSDITKTMVDSVLGSTTAGNANRFLMSTGSTSVWAAISKTNVTDALGYTPLSTGGGTISGSASSPLKLNTSSTTIGIPLSVSNSEKAWVGWSAGQGAYLWNANANKYLGIKEDGTPHYNGNTLIHSGNYSDYALKIEQVAQSQTDNSWIQEYALKNRKSFVYNSNGDEWAYLIGLNDTSEVGAILRMGYASATLQVKTVVNGTWSGWKSVAFLTSTVANAEKVAGIDVSVGLNKPWGTIPAITNGGYMDVGRHFEFHYDNTTGSDFSTILQCTGNYSNMVSLPSASGTLALLTDNVASATKLQTARTIWGQSFDGTGNVDGLLTIGYGSTTNSISNSIGLHLNRTGASSIASAGIALTNEGVGALLLGGNGGCLDIYTYNGTTASKRMLINASGNVTFGGSDLAGTTYKMSVDGKVHIRATAGAAMTEGAGSLIVGNGAVLMIDANDIQSKTNGTTAGPLYINDWGGNVILCGQNKGNVLIGTMTDSGYKLDVNGVIKNNNYVMTGFGVFVGSSYDNRLTNGLYAGNLISGSLTASDLCLYSTAKLSLYGGGGVVINSAVTMSSTLSVAGQTTINNNLVVSGDTSSGSDIRFKDIIKNKTIKIADIAKAPLFTFKWNDREDDTIHLGSSAQYWEKVCPWLVTGEDFKSLNYAVGAMGGVISLARHDLQQDKEIKAQGKEIKALKRAVKVLKKENKALKEEIRRMQYGS